MPAKITALQIELNDLNAGRGRRVPLCECCGCSSLQLLTGWSLVPSLEAKTLRMKPGGFQRLLYEEDQSGGCLIVVIPAL